MSAKVLVVLSSMLRLALKSLPKPTMPMTSNDSLCTNSDAIQSNSGLPEVLHALRGARLKGSTCDAPPGSFQGMDHNNYLEAACQGVGL